MSPSSMRMSGDLNKVHVAAQAKPAAAGDVVCHNCGRKGHYARDCPGMPTVGRKNGKTKSEASYSSQEREKVAEAKSKDVAKASFERSKKAKSVRNLKSVKNQKLSKRRWNPRARRPWW